MLFTFHESKHTKKTLQTQAIDQETIVQSIHWRKLHVMKALSIWESLAEHCAKWKPLNSSALNGWNSHSKCFSVYLYKLFTKLSERNHTDLLSAVLSGTCRTRSLCPRSKTPADYHPSVKLSVYSSDLPVNMCNIYKWCVIWPRMIDTYLYFHVFLH